MVSANAPVSRGPSPLRTHLGRAKCYVFGPLLFLLLTFASCLVACTHAEHLGLKHHTGVRIL